jgi:hypothetical protein
MPDILPVDTFRFNPSGREPKAMLQEYGTIPPVAVKVSLYELPTVPSGKSEPAVI